MHNRYGLEQTERSLVMEILRRVSICWAKMPPSHRAQILVQMKVRGLPLMQGKSLVEVVKLPRFQELPRGLRAELLLALNPSGTRFDLTDYWLIKKRIQQGIGGQ